MQVRKLLFWVTPLLIVAVVAYTKHVTTPRLLLYLFLSATSLVITLIGYTAVVGDMRDFVASEAEGKRISTWHMFGIMVGKALLYIFLPAIIITAIIFTIVLSLRP